MLRSRTTARAAIVGALVGAACGIGSNWLFSPEKHLTSDRLYVFVGDSCPYTHGILRQLESNEELRRRVVPVVAQEVSEQTRVRICALLAEDVRNRAPWFEVLGVSEEWVCTRVERWSRAVFHREFGKLPSWSLGQRPVPWRREQSTLAAHGLRMTGDSDRPLQDFRSQHPRESGGEQLVETQGSSGRSDPAEGSGEHETQLVLDKRRIKVTHWRGYDIGF
jgi:hypothetical protein